MPGEGAGAELCSLEMQGCVNTGWQQKGPSLTQAAHSVFAYRKDLCFAGVFPACAPPGGSWWYDPSTHQAGTLKKMHPIFFPSRSLPFPLTPSIKPVPFSASHTSSKVWLLVRRKHNWLRGLWQPRQPPALPRAHQQQLRAQARAGPLTGRGVGAQGQPAGAASSAPREAAAPARPGSSLFPPRPTQPRLRPAAAPSLAESQLRQRHQRRGRHATLQCSPLPPRVLTRLQGAEQPGRGPRNAAALLEHIAQDGAHAATTAAAATTLPLQASPSTSQGAGQLVLPHPRAPWDPALRLGSRRSTGVAAWRARGAWWDRLVESPWEAARMLGNRGSRGEPWELPRVGRQAGICSAEPARLRLGEGLGRGGGRERSSARRRRRRSRPQSRHHRAQAGQP